MEEEEDIEKEGEEDHKGFPIVDSTDFRLSLLLLAIDYEMYKCAI